MANESHQPPVPNFGTARDDRELPRISTAADPETEPLKERGTQSMTGQPHHQGDDATVRQAGVQDSHPVSSQWHGETQTKVVEETPANYMKPDLTTLSQLQRHGDTETQTATSETNQQRAESHRAQSAVDVHTSTIIPTADPPSRPGPSAFSFEIGSPIAQVYPSNSQLTRGGAHPNDWSSVSSTEHAPESLSTTLAMMSSEYPPSHTHKLQDGKVQLVVPARSHLVTGPNISTATDNSSLSFSLDNILATSLHSKVSIPDTSSADRQQIEPETKSNGPRSLHLLGSMPESHAQTQFGPEAKSKGPRSLHLPDSIPDSSLTSADDVKRKVSQLQSSYMPAVLAHLHSTVSDGQTSEEDTGISAFSSILASSNSAGTQEHSSPDHGLTQGVIAHIQPRVATNQGPHEERLMAYIQAPIESPVRGEDKSSKRVPAVRAIKGLNTDSGLDSTISRTSEVSSGLSLGSILVRSLSSANSNNSTTPVVLPEATGSASSIDSVTQAGYLTDHPRRPSDETSPNIVSVRGDSTGLGAGYIPTIVTGMSVSFQSYQPAFSHSPALTGVEFLQSSVRPKSMFSVSEQDKLSRRPDKQKLKKGNDYMGLARENVTEFPEDAQEYCETAFELYSMMNPKGPEAQMDMTKDFIVAIQAYFNDQKFEEALDYVQAVDKLQSTNPEDKIEVLKLKAATLDAQGKTQEAQECRERIFSVQ